MAAKLTDLEKKKIIADYTLCENYSETARINNVSRVTVRRVVESNAGVAEKVRQKKRENERDILSYLDGKKDKVCSIIGKGLDILDDEEKLMQATPAQITTAIGTLIDKFTGVSKLSEDSSVQDDAVTKALKEEAERLNNAD